MTNNVQQYVNSLNSIPFIYRPQEADPNISFLNFGSNAGRFLRFEASKGFTVVTKKSEASSLSIISEQMCGLFKEIHERRISGEKGWLTDDVYKNFMRNAFSVNKKINEHNERFSEKSWIKRIFSHGKIRPIYIRFNEKKKYQETYQTLNVFKRIFLHLAGKYQIVDTNIIGKMCKDNLFFNVNNVRAKMGFHAINFSLIKGKKLLDELTKLQENLIQASTTEARFDAFKKFTLWQQQLTEEDLKRLGRLVGKENLQLSFMNAMQVASQVPAPLPAVSSAPAAVPLSEVSTTVARTQVPPPPMVDVPVAPSVDVPVAPSDDVPDAPPMDEVTTEQTKKLMQTLHKQQANMQEALDKSNIADNVFAKLDNMQPQSPQQSQSPQSDMLAKIREGVKLKKTPVQKTATPTLSLQDSVFAKMTNQLCSLHTKLLSLEKFARFLCRQLLF